jgi:hypothetical protein
MQFVHGMYIRDACLCMSWVCVLLLKHHARLEKVCANMLMRVCFLRVPYTLLFSSGSRGQQCQAPCQTRAGMKP